MRARLLIASILVAGCGPGFTWRLETKPPVLTSQLDWTRELGAALQIVPAADTLYVAAEKGIYAMKADGTRVWATPMPAARRYLAVGEGKVVVTSYILGEKQHYTDRSGSDINTRDQGHVTGFDAATGQQAWDIPYDREKSKLSPPTIGGGRAAWVSGPNLIVVDLATGQPSWAALALSDNKLTRAIPFSRPAPAISGAKVCVGVGWEFQLYDLASGQKTGDESVAGGGVAASSLGGDGVCWMGRSRVGEEGGFGAGTNEVWAVDTARPKKLKRKYVVELGNDLSDLGVSNVASNSSTVFALSNFRIVAADKATGKRKWELHGKPVWPVSNQRGTRTSHAGAFSFDMARGTVFNDTPGTNFFVTETRVIVPAWMKDPQTKQGRDVVTVLDAATGAYLGSYDAAGAVVLDVAATADGTLFISTDQGWKTAKLDAFAPTVAAR